MEKLTTMKWIYSAIVSTLIYSLFFGNIAVAEKKDVLDIFDLENISCSEYGPDSAFTVREYSLYRTHFDQENYELAAPHWRYVFKNAPAIRQRLHIDGVRMYKDFISKETDDARKEKLIDTLFLIYDTRMKCFSEDPTVLGFKASDMFNLRPSDNEAIRKTFKRSFELAGKDNRHFFVHPYILTVVRAERANNLEKEEVIKVYEEMMDIIDYNIGKNNDVAGFTAARERIEPLISEYLDCETLLPIVKRNYPDNKDNAEQLERMYNQLRMARCQSDPIFMKVLISLNEQNPSAENAFRIANSLSTSGRLRESIPYYNQAAELENDRAKKAEYFLELAKVYRRLENFPQSRTFARQAINLRSSWGEPYILIGDLYASSGPLCGEGTGWDSQVVTWIAIDMYERAKQVDGSVASEANQRISRYEKFMPSRGESFMRDLTEGDSYKIECWINETTTVRYGPSN
ncbi:MAG: tetratricopeptide repeat protein [Chitinophagaceae bacterium]|nr:MAG: tetratricopeptide repeat protein [Chitinophagaceae bacterium]